MSTEKTSPPTPKSVAVVSKIGPEEGARIASEIGSWLKKRGIRVRLDDDTSRALGLGRGAPTGPLPRGIDLVIVAGGDGTLLSVARSAAPRGIPILGINFGGLGFLTELNPEELFDGLERVIRGDYTVEERQLLRVRYRRNDKTLREYAVLNDAVVTKTALARMIELDVLVDRSKVASYTSDGLIISTPTGSTAYNLSAGGPILDPRVRAFVIAPICPHTMTYRPLVVPATVKVEVVLRATAEEVYLTLDGQIGFPMRGDDSMIVEDHPSPVRLVRVAGRSFFEVLRRKLRWGER
ncbi:MAG: NAD(+)/NADH kinase [Acidobacteriota bacterium]|nr:NAD(+)/NADH kinase [Acidobacteriota bacterium]